MLQTRFHFLFSRMKMDMKHMIHLLGYSFLFIQFYTLRYCSYQCLKVKLPVRGDTVMLPVKALRQCYLPRPYDNATCQGYGNTTSGSFRSRLPRVLIKGKEPVRGTLRSNDTCQGLKLLLPVRSAMVTSPTRAFR